MAQHSNPGVVPLGARPLPICSPVTSPMNTPGNSNHDRSNSVGGNTNGNGNGNGSDGIDVDNGAIGVSKITNDDEMDDEGSRSLLASTSGLGLGNDHHNDTTIANDISASLGTTMTPTTPLKRKLTNKRRRGIRRCRKCQDNYKPPRAHHDSVTGRCIVKMDHFCPWVGNAVGALNHKFFFLFILYTFITSLLSLLLLLIRFIRCGFTVLMDGEDSADGSADESGDMDYYNNMTNADDLLIDYNNNSTRLLQSLHQNQHVHFFSRVLGTTSNNNDDDEFPNEQRMFKYDECEASSTFSIPIVLLLTMSIAFLVFTCCMLFEQIEAIETNVSKIARMKRRMGHATEDVQEYQRVSQDFNEFFGGDRPGMALHWFLPVKVWFPVGRRDRVMGFEYREEWYGEPYREEMDDDDDNDIVQDGGRGRNGDDEEARLGMEQGELELGDFSTHSEKKVKVSSLVAKEGEESDLNLQIQLPMGNNDIQLPIKKKSTLKKRA